jgi:hypothetical protein
MSYAISPSTKRMIAAKQGMKSTGYVANQSIPTPGHVSQSKPSASGEMYSGQYAQPLNQQSAAQSNSQYAAQSNQQYVQQSNPANHYRMARRTPPQQPTGQQMMYQQ